VQLKPNGWTEVQPLQSKDEFERVLSISGGDEAGDPEEGAFVVGVGEFGDGLAGGFGVGAGGVHGVGEGAVAVEDFEDVGVGDVGEAAVGEDGADGFAVGTRPAFEGVDDGQRGLAFAEVGGGGFAEDVVLGGEVEDVVDDLEGEAEVAAVLAEGLYSSSLMRRPSFSICRSSPSTICCVSEMRRSRMRKLRSASAVWKDCM